MKLKAFALQMQATAYLQLTVNHSAALVLYGYRNEEWQEGRSGSSGKLLNDLQ